MKTLLIASALVFCAAFARAQTSDPVSAAVNTIVMVHQQDQSTIKGLQAQVTQLQAQLAAAQAAPACDAACTAAKAVVTWLGADTAAAVQAWIAQSQGLAGILAYGPGSAPNGMLDVAGVGGCTVDAPSPAAAKAKP